jgi:hypothetical protein
MRLAVLVSLCLLSIIAAPQKKNAQQKPPEIELLDATVKRDGTDILLDGKVKNCGDKAIKDLVIFFHFYDADMQPITTRKGGIEQETFTAGDVAEFHAQMEQPPRATHYMIDFQDGGGKYLRPAVTPATNAIE